MNSKVCIKLYFEVDFTGTKLELYITVIFYGYSIVYLLQLFSVTSDAFRMRQCVLLIYSREISYHYGDSRSTDVITLEKPAQDE